MPLPLPESLLALPHLRDVPFARLTTLGVGGLCRWLFEPQDEAQAVVFVRTCHQEGLPYRVLGGGSNLLVLGDVQEPVVRLRLGGTVQRHGTRMTAPASLGHIRLGEAAAEAGLSGYEHACGIPGTCGGALAMNAGANGRELVEVLHRYRYVTPEGELMDRAPEPGDFAYRWSHLRHCGLALSMTLDLVAGDPEVIRQRMAAYRAKRSASQPLSQRNAGCVFKNPPGDHAGRLIEAAGLKGHQVGEACVSPVHGNFLVNTGACAAADFQALVDVVRSRVEERFGVRLELEVEVWGAEGEARP